MEDLIRHPMRMRANRDERARQNFVTGLRAFVLNNMATGMRRVYEGRVEPQFEHSHGRKPADGDEVHQAMKPEPYFRFYSSMRYNAQEMVWRSILPILERERDDVRDRARELSAEAEREGARLELDEHLETPRNVTAVDVHLMPGNYHGEFGDDDVSMGALYDHGLAVFSFGMMGSNLDDIGRSVAGYVKGRYPDFQPQRILDLGCTIGHNTVPWAKEYPDAEVHAIDVGAPGLRYGHARARANGVGVHFHQMNATTLDFDDESFDVVFSSMFLHELPKKDIRKVLAEACRVLRPGGLMIHMELPPNNQMSAYDGFYLDWDCWYNNEPYYKPFRDLDTRRLCADAGFDPERYVQFVIPSREGYGEDTFQASVSRDQEVGRDTTGRLAAGVQWFTFGAWK